MAKNAPVRKSSYKTLSHEKLAVFAGNVFSRMSSNPAYQQYAADITTLGTLNDQYRTAVEKAKDRAVSSIIYRNQLQKGVTDMLDLITDNLIRDYTGDDLWIANAGMEVAASNGRSNGVLEPPFNLRVTNNQISGELALNFQVSDPRNVLLNAVEYSADNGVTWHNGTYGKSRGIRLTNLPSRQELMVRVRSLGTFSRKSGWSDPILAYVF